jgi:hypothetical protein
LTLKNQNSPKLACYWGCKRLLLAFINFLRKKDGMGSKNRTAFIEFKHPCVFA